MSITCPDDTSSENACIPRNSCFGFLLRTRSQNIGPPSLLSLFGLRPSDFASPAVRKEEGEQEMPAQRHAERRFRRRAAGRQLSKDAGVGKLVIYLFQSTQMLCSI